MNYGWDDGHTTWYTLDDYHCPVEPDPCDQEHEFIVRNIAPDKGIWLTADTTFGWAPFEVLFTGSSEYSVDEWTWDFGDDNGATVFVDTVTHTYDSSGMFDVSLAIDTGGGTLTLQRSDYVIALADSMIAVDIVGGKGDTVEVVIRARNTIPLYKIIIPIETFGNLNVTHGYGAFSTDGCRTDYFETQTYQHFDPSNSRYTIKLETSSSDLQPGEGSILKLYFIIPGSASSGQTDTVEVDGYLQYLPLFSGSIAEYQAVPMAGTITSGCCNTDGMRGDATGDGSLNVTDVIFLVSYIFFGGPPPPCLEEGDVNGDGSINIVDVVYLVQFIFLGGPSPADCP
jgi:PKD repeat protein